MWRSYPNTNHSAMNAKRAKIGRTQKAIPPTSTAIEMGQRDGVDPAVIGFYVPNISEKIETQIDKNRISENIQIKEFGVILVTKNTDLSSNVCTYKTCTFNPTVIKDWSRKSQIPQYLSTLFTGPDTNNKFVSKVNSVQISTDSNLALSNDESGIASMNWTDSNADVSINTIGRIW